MAKSSQKDLLARVADLGEEALHKLPQVPGSGKVMEMVNQSRTRLDEMQRKLRGLDVLEQRVDKLEQRLARLEQGAKKPAPKKPTTPKKPPA